MSSRRAPTTSNTYRLFYSTNKIVITPDEKTNWLGEGSQGTVEIWTFKNRDPLQDEKVAVKMTKKRRSIRQAKKEIDIFNKLGEHKHLVKLKGYYWNSNCTLQVMELCCGGDLFEMVKKRTLNPHESLHILLQFFLVVEFLHSNGILHRDLKLENTLITSKARTSQGVTFEIKVCDLGLATELKEGAFASNLCGTPVYYAPEMAQGLAYDTKVDIWCVGVMLFTMLHGDYPFELDNTARTPFVCNQSLPNNLKDYLDCLLMADPARRPTIGQCRAMVNHQKGHPEV